MDKRTDIWAFGCVLYEMLSGRRAFDGDTISDTFVSVLEHEPDWDALPAATPASIRTLLERCLRKDPRKRLHDIADALIELEEPASRSHQRDPRPMERRTVGPQTAAARPDDCRALLGGAALLATATGLTSWLVGQRPTAPTDIRCRPPDAEDRGRDGRESSTPGGQVLYAVRPLARRHAARHSRIRQRTIPTLSATAVRIRDQTHSWYRACDNAVLLTRWPLDRLLASGGSHPPQSLARGRFSDRDCSDRRTDRCALDIERRDRDPKWRSHGELWSVPASGGTPNAIAVRDRSAGELISLRAPLPGSHDLRSQTLASTEPGSRCCRVRRERDDDCFAAAATSWRATPGRAVSCSRTVTRSWPCL